MKKLISLLVGFLSVAGAGFEKGNGAEYLFLFFPAPALVPIPLNGSEYFAERD